MASSTKREVDSVTASMTTEELNNLVFSFSHPNIVYRHYANKSTKFI